MLLKCNGVSSRRWDLMVGRGFESPCELLASAFGDCAMDMISAIYHG